MAEATLRVLVADDEAMVRAGLAMIIDAEVDMTVVGQAEAGDQAVELTVALTPHVVVMDVKMPRMDGIEATRRLVSEDFISGSDFATAVLILTTFHDDAAVHAALRAGASGFLLKNAAPRSLCDAIRAVGSGDAWLDPSVARRLLAEFAARPDDELPSPEELDRLTLREREVLMLCAHGLNNAAIARHLVVTEATIKTHMGRVLTKLGLRDRSQAVAVAYKTGLVRPTDRTPAPR